MYISRFYRPRPLKETSKKGMPPNSMDKENYTPGKEILQSQEENIAKVQGMEETISDLRNELEMKEDENRKCSDKHEIEIKETQEKVFDLDSRQGEKELQLQRSLNENVDLRKKLDIQSECIVKTNMEIDNLKNTVNEIQNENKIKSGKRELCY